MLEAQANLLRIEKSPLKFPLPTCQTHNIPPSSQLINNPRSAESRHFDLNQNHVMCGGGRGNVLLQIPEHHICFLQCTHLTTVSKEWLDAHTPASPHLTMWASSSHPICRSEDGRARMTRDVGGEPSFRALKHCHGTAHVCGSVGQWHSQHCLAESPLPS